LAVAEEPPVEVVSLQVFVSLALVVGSLLLFGFACRQRDFEHADRLALLPLAEDGAEPARESTPETKGPRRP
jgi:hypothetical protein